MRDIRTSPGAAERENGTEEDAKDTPEEMAQRDMQMELMDIHPNCSSR